MSKQTDLEKTRFLNVDLDIYSSADLQPLVSTLGERVIVLYVGREKRTYSAHLELARVTKNADSTIRHFCALIESLPKAARQLWNNAKNRDFNVGVRAGPQPNSCRFALEAETVKVASDVGARIVLTVYGTEPRTLLPAEPRLGD
jgi:hypothetical protein